MKYRLVNFKDHLTSLGMSLSEFRSEAFKIVGRHLSDKTWSDGVNTRGVSERTINKMKIVASKTLEALEKPCPESALISVAVEQHEE